MNRFEITDALQKAVRARVHTDAPLKPYTTWKIGGPASSFVSGFCTALLNTVFFMSALVLLFGNTDYIKGLFEAKGQSQTFTGTIVFICLFVGINAVVEMITSTIVCGGVGTALYQAHILPIHQKSES